MSLTKKSKLRSCSLSDLQVNLERMITRVNPNFSLQSKANHRQVIEQSSNLQPGLLTKKVETIKNATTISTASVVAATIATSGVEPIERELHGTATEEMNQNQKQQPNRPNFYPPSTFPSLALMNQLKTWTIGRKLKGKLKKMTASRTPSNASASSSEPNVDDQSLPSMLLPNTSSSSEPDDSASSDMASGGSTHDPSDHHGASHWLSSDSSAPSSIPPSSPTDLEKAIESLPTDILSKIEIVAVSLTKDERGELGIYVKGKLDSNATLCYFIADFEKSGPAEKCAQLQIGDEVLMVGSNCLRGLPLEEALRFLRSIDNTISLIVARKKSEPTDMTSGSSPPPTPASTMATNHVGALNSTLISTRRRSQYSPSPSQELSFDFRRASYAIDGLATVNRTQANSSIGNDSPFARISSTGSMLESGLCTVPRKPKNSNLVRPDTQSCFTITFQKGIGHKGLGFSIVGGSDLGRSIYVKSIYPTGQAAEKGLLREGDEIVTINGVPTANLTHVEAINQFKRVKAGEIVISCRRLGNSYNINTASQVSHNAINNKLKADNYKSCSALDLVQYPRINS